jgi:pyruvate,water dikinase
MEYVPIFKLPYSNVFLTNILFEGGYKNFDTLVTIKNGKWELFISKENINKLSNDRYQEVLNGIDLNKFNDDFIKTKKEFDILSNKEINKLSHKEFIKILKDFIDTAIKYLKLYITTEFFMYNKIEKEINEFIEGKFSFEDILSDKIDLKIFPKNIRILTEHLSKMQHIKLEMRKTMNEVIMGPESLTARILTQLVLISGKDDATSMTIEEVINFLENKKFIDVSDRHIYSYITWDKKLKILSGAEAYKKIRELDKKIPKNEVTGTPACKGLVKGIAKVIPFSMNPTDYFHKMEKGNILVSDTTGPEMMVLIEKASAIVTDEGGITSHAAIISREFNIPCVVGTKYATEIFKDGDLIEVNAFNGIVKKINEIKK